MENKMSAKFVFMMVGLAVVCGSIRGETTANECSDDLQKVTTCLTFATGKSSTPTKDCCSAVTDIKDSNPACLCFIIVQIHNGTNPQLKSMGIQEARLLQLPSACKLANASSSDCPKLLHLAPNSPEAAIFNNATADASPTTTGSTPSSSSSSSSDGSDGFKIGPQLAGSMAVAMIVFFYFAIFTLG
ncbi:hypothetical protein LguiA_000071 [Lonicera macranthoides]